MKNAIIAVLIGVLSGTALAGEASTTQAPKGYVTIQDIPEVVVVAYRWSADDEAAFQRNQHTVAKNEASTHKGLMGRLLAYVGR